MQNKKAITIFATMAMLSGCSPGGIRSDGSGSNDSNAGAVVGALALIGAGILWKNKNSIFIDTDSNKSATNKKPNSSVPTDVKSPNFKHVYNHIYTPVTTFKNEKKGYGLYTYVLLNKQIGADGDALKKYREKAKLVLELAQSHQPSKNVSDVFFSKSKDFNNFIIPTTNKSVSIVTLDNYAFSLSSKLLATIASTLSEYGNPNMSTKFRKSSGPFLVTTLKPISQTGDELYFLYVDMSSFRPSAIHEVMDTYTLKLENPKSGNMPFNQFETMRLNALKNLVEFNNAIGVVKESVPGG